MPSQKRPPNVIVFFTDQQRWDSTGLHGCPLDLTPNYDRMAREGTHLSHLFTSQPVCGPARSCFQSGQWATQTGCWRNYIPLPHEIPTLAKSFNGAGYHTGYIGKWHLSVAGRGAVPEADRGGYQYWLGSNTLEFTSDAYQTTLYNNANEPVQLPGYRVDALTDAAIRYIDDQKENPFFLFLSYIEPHHQNHRDDYPAPDGYAERYQGRWTPPDLLALGGSSQQHLAGYWGMIKRLDEALGRIRDSLKSLALDRDTIILFTTDHGCHFKTRNSEYKRSCHEASIRLPGAVCGPGFEGGGDVRQLVSLLDLPPTLLDAAGIEIPDTFAGRSVLPLLRGDTQDWPEEVFVQISEAEVGRAIRTHRWKYAVRAPNEGPDKPETGAASDVYHEQYLYDLYSDPYELKNLAGCRPHREISDQLQARLLQRMEAAGEAVPRIEPAQPSHGGQRIVEAATELDAVTWLRPDMTKD
ncbi:MAG: sulfatase-like hydrolase/transferase [Opitutales bacterium]